MPETRTEPRLDKVAAVAELTAAFRDSSATMLTEYRGLTMAAITTLRRTLGDDTTYRVVKNTLTKRAAAEAGISLDEKVFTGPTAIAFVGGDPVLAAKGIRDFSKTNPLLVIKGAVVDGEFLSADEVRQLADLESREVLLSKLAGAMLASLTQAAALFQAPLSQVARLAQALADQKASVAPEETAPEAVAAPEDHAAPEAAVAETTDDTSAEPASDTPAEPAEDAPKP